jgi:Rrf2 family protein
MRMSEGVEWAIHCCTVLGFLPPDRTLPATRLAEFHGVPPAYLAKHLQVLSRAGIVESVAGRRGGYRLARPPGEITLLDVVQAVDGPEPAFQCTEIRQRGPAAVGPEAYRRPCAIHRAMAAAEAAWRAELRARTVAHVMADLTETVTPEAAALALDWFAAATN